MITILGAPKAFEDEIAVLQRNAIRTWRELDPSVQILLFGDESGVEEMAAEVQAEWLGPLDRNRTGTPLISSVFGGGLARAKWPTVAYVNSDILLVDDFLPSIERVRQGLEKFLVVGERWDLDLDQAIDFEPDWRMELRREVSARGRRHPPMGSDYFVLPRQPHWDMPAFALGRAGWDNWMIFQGRALGWPVVDASASILAVHQNHDYRHLPGGRSHHHLPESDENVRLAGGRRAIFTLRDANWALADQGPPRRRPVGPRLGREIELFPLFRLHSPALAEAAHALLHPRESWMRVRGWAHVRLRRLRGRTS